MVASGPAIDKEYNVALYDDQIIPDKAIKQSVTVREGTELPAEQMGC